MGPALEAVRAAGRNRTPRDEAGRAALAELFQVAGWIAFDAERHGMSQRLHLRALELARGAGRPHRPPWNRWSSRCRRCRRSTWADP
ncbi:hypothetical protein WKI68_00605 [Streptomyces sp. MS1.HAVA.3]|uniref:Uncharacterized protein n=1 Tax=Streptomyces caledonius TaxID=3134107 RepID=A0ABU8TXI5_9ACTN